MHYFGAVHPTMDGFIFWVTMACLAVIIWNNRDKLRPK